MEILVIDQALVGQLLPMGEAIEVVAEAFRTLGRGEALNPLRQGMWLPQRKGILAMMPAFLGSIGAMGLKAITVFPGNEGTEYDSHQGAVLLFGTEQGRLRAILDASAITAIRTAAASGVATRLLAREDAQELAILGSGVQASSHLEAMLLVREIRRVRVWSRTMENAQRFAQQESKRYEIPVEATATAQEAAEGADIICTTTAALEPVLLGDWLVPGTHINAVGSSVPFARELDTGAVVKSRLFVDRRESTLSEAGDFLIPQEEGAIDASHIQGELSEILLRQIPGRGSIEEITLFKSLGLAIQDVASAHHIYQQAVQMGLGTTVELGGSRHAGV